ncbi:MAG TPA: hypothetical protein EYQ64_06725 [Gemmatimonadetes bacterium]|nr:hypothetical protein [Gemmatimonadota bacterium]
MLGVPTRDFEVDATAVLTFNAETYSGSMDIDATFDQGDHTVTVDALVEYGEGDNTSAHEGGTVNITVDGVLFAVVTVSEDPETGVETATVTDGNGGELTAAEAQAVRASFCGLPPARPKQPRCSIVGYIVSGVNRQGRMGDRAACRAGHVGSILLEVSDAD